MSPEIQTIAIATFWSIFVFVVGAPIARAIARRIESGGAKPKLDAEVLRRLERLEQAMDSVAVEVERISEGQRFVAKVIGERHSPELSERAGR